MAALNYVNAIRLRGFLAVAGGWPMKTGLCSRNVA